MLCMEDFAIRYKAGLKEGLGITLGQLEALDSCEERCQTLIVSVQLIEVLACRRIEEIPLSVTS